MRLVYVTGPSGQGDAVKHARDAMLLAEEMWADGIVSHLAVLQHMLSPRPIEEWRLVNQELARGCDVILRMPGPSPDARNRGVPVFDDYKALPAFAREGSDG